jgi:excisionase family DNA binding protein
MTTRLDALRTEMSELRSGQPKVSPRPFLSLREAARRLGVSRNSTLVDLIADRRIKTVRVNGRVKVPASEVERVIREASR